jgi:hypothetical protein
MCCDLLLCCAFPPPTPTAPVSPQWDSLCTLEKEELLAGEEESRREFLGDLRSRLCNRDGGSEETDEGGTDGEGGRGGRLVEDEEEDAAATKRQEKLRNGYDNYRGASLSVGLSPQRCGNYM